MPYTPQFVVDWLYQGVLGTVRVLEAILGFVRYSAEGYPLGDGAGQVMLFGAAIWEAFASKLSSFGITM